MKKHFLWLITFLFVVSIAFAEVDNSLFDAKSVLIDFNLKNSFSVVPTKPSYEIDSITANSFWYPIDDYRQTSESIMTIPSSDFIENKSYSFTWERPRSLSFEMEESSRILLEKKLFMIDKKVNFPLKNIPQSYSIYLKPGEITDSNENIKNLASSIAAGKDDAMFVVFDLATWVENNIQYDLSSVTADASQKSSWVLENKKGVCDELTSLFISMSRSVGIPARFVSGVSYSNVNLENDGWGPHGWAEVYIPNYGWVPVDVTYKQIGYVDATHIKLNVEQDSKSSSVEYASFGRNIKIKSGTLDFNIDVIKKVPAADQLLDLKFDVEKEEVGFGSYNLAILTATNKKEYYVSENIRLAKVSDLVFDQSLNLPIMLKPYESKKYYWLIKTPDTLNKNYVYTFPLVAKGEFGEQAEGSFIMQKIAEVYSKEYMTSKIPVLQDSKPLSKFLDVKCSAMPSELYFGESSKINCKVNNNGDLQIKNAKICLEKNCTNKSLSPNSRNEFDYEYKTTSIGSTTLTFSIYSDSAFLADYITLISKDEPKIEIEDVSHPINLSFEDQSEIKITLAKTSSSNPLNTKIQVIHKTLNQIWQVDMQKERNELRYNLKGSDLQEGRNDFKIILSYEDDKGKKYSEQKEFSIILNEPTFGQKILLWMNAVDYKINKFIESI